MIYFNIKKLFINQIFLNHKGTKEAKEYKHLSHTFSREMFFLSKEWEINKMLV
jgi:hypothetical protein